MWKPHINVVLFSTLLVVHVSRVFAESEQFHFQRMEDQARINCSDHVSRVNNAMSTKQCCTYCSRNVQCRGVMYDPVTMTCKEVNKTTFPDQTCQTANGAAYYSKVSACDSYLVSGTHGVEDYQLSESAYFCQINPSKSHCQPPEAMIFSARYSRLNYTGLFTGGWLAGHKDPYQYIQVDFEKATTVTKVVMQDRSSVWNPHAGGGPKPIVQYVTHFKFLYSQDCSDFEELRDDNGNILVLEGNSSPNQTVIRDLHRKVTARCFRINPVKWFYSVTLRFDLIGCL